MIMALCTAIATIIFASPRSIIWDLGVFYIIGTFVFGLKKYLSYRKELRFLREFHHLSQALDDIRILESSNPFSRILESVVRIVGFDRAVLFLLDSEGEHLSAIQAVNIDEKAWTGFEISRSETECMAWQVIETTEIIIANRQKSNNSCDQRLLGLIDSAFTAIVPIVYAGSAHGFLMIARLDQANEINDDDLLQMQILSDQIAISLQNHNLHAELSLRAEILADQNEQIQRELILAKSVQEGVLPKGPPGWQGAEVASFIKAARFIGGDFFHFFYDKYLEPECSNSGKYPKESVEGILIGDVSGKGIPAALVMAVVNCLFRERWKKFSDPALIMNEVNTSLKDYLGSESRFNSSAFLGFLIPERKQFVYANAGHDFPLYFSANSGQVETLASTGTLLGIFDDTKYSSITMDVSHGDRIFFYTDGLIDLLELAMGNEDGLEYLKTFLMKNSSLKPADFIIELEKLIKSRFSSISDDITAVIIAVN